MDTSGKALHDHWSWAVNKGLMNRNTGNSFRSACAKVLPVLEDWQEVDIQKLDVEDTLTRFVNLHNKDFKPNSLDAYKRRFQQAVNSFLEYADDPAAWQPISRSTNGRKGGGPTKPPVSSNTNSTPAARGQLKGTNLHEYEFPIRDGVMARLTIPRDVTSAEMRRLLAWAKTLAVDFDFE